MMREGEDIWGLGHIKRNKEKGGREGRQLLKLFKKLLKKWKRRKKEAMYKATIRKTLQTGTLFYWVIFFIIICCKLHHKQEQVLSRAGWDEWGDKLEWRRDRTNVEKRRDRSKSAPRQLASWRVFRVNTLLSPVPTPTCQETMFWVFYMSHRQLTVCFPVCVLLSACVGMRQASINSPKQQVPRNTLCATGSYCMTASLSFSFSYSVFWKVSHEMNFSANAGNRYEWAGMKSNFSQPGAETLKAKQLTQLYIMDTTFTELYLGDLWFSEDCSSGVIRPAERFISLIIIFHLLMCAQYLTFFCKV